MSSPYRMRQLPRVLAAAAVLLLSVATSGCGEEEAQGRLLNPEKSDRLQELLDQVEEQFDDGECDQLQGTLEDLETEVEEIDPEVEESVRKALQTEAQDLINLASEDCQEPVTTTETTIAPPLPTTTFETVPTTTEETEPTTTEEEEPPEEVPPEEPPRQGPNGEGPPGQEEGGEAESGSLKPPKEEKKEKAAAGPRDET